MMIKLPGVIPDLDNQETKKKKEQIDSYPKSRPPSVQRILFPNNKSSETSPNPNRMDDPDPKEVTYKSMRGMMTKVLFDVLPKVLPQAVVKDLLPNKRLMHQNLYNVHGIASDSANKKDKIEEVFNKDSKAANPYGHAPKVNESEKNPYNVHRMASDLVDKKDKLEEVDNKDSEALISDEHAPKVDEFEVAVEEHIF
ncbi:hypothetical protein LWI28_001002 [Acer negundo]|uniref:Uncharacterized protein n=1 Tax=Acer negundo TaxID=4023 RepID=A0AAD5IBD8_ACENE|nr:hypothetical protein LWI28_001002 [Acer negundo]